MRPAFLCGLLLAATPALAQPAPPPAAAAAAREAAPSAVDLLFEGKHFAAAPAGSRITYRYTRFSGIKDGPFGAPIEDRIVETVAAGSGPDSRNLTIEAFTGERRLPTAHYENMTGNPLLAQFLEYHVLDIAKALQGNPRYLKNGLRKAMREGGPATPTEVEVGGEKRPGWRVVLRPFVNDPVKDKLRGFDSLTYTFVLSPAVPGEIVSIDVEAPGPEGGKLLQETVTYEPSVG
ncbi:conserved hypothetical protein [Methylobacterium sp. 4-46]|uniref:hypothetical protein n=1 Tax=unclassified Methylobacterium TaxID=2615210 RepID=UPI000152DA9F|nr:MULTISPECIES: hypothetical protein [Methylobacterium]ACA20057.1 conserved hypothetical protein [Methylobacterium sp. 4-46]WFT79244.1 hypothetical protein QA634_29120 [Methylobacterium nodulans]